MIVLPRQDARDIAQIAQQQLAAGGFEVELVNQEIGQFVQDWRNSNFDMFVSANGGGPDPDHLLLPHLLRRRLDQRLPV